MMNTYWMLALGVAIGLLVRPFMRGFVLPLAGEIWYGYLETRLNKAWRDRNAKKSFLADPVIARVDMELRLAGNDHAAILRPLRVDCDFSLAFDKMMGAASSLRTARRYLSFNVPTN